MHRNDNSGNKTPPQEKHIEYISDDGSDFPSELFRLFSECLPETEIPITYIGEYDGRYKGIVERVMREIDGELIREAAWLNKPNRR